jgi:hypothetical protein
MDTPKSPAGADLVQPSSTQSPSKLNRSGLFKRPKWQEDRLRAEKEATVDGVDIFRRAEDTSRVIKQREIERKEERKERKAERQVERRDSRDMATDHAAPAPSVRLHIDM